MKDALMHEYVMNEAIVKHQKNLSIWIKCHKQESLNFKHERLTFQSDEDD